MLDALEREPIRILTNHPGQQESSSWRESSTYLSVAGRGLVPAIRLGLKLYLKHWSSDCIVLGAGRSNEMFAFLQTLLPFGRKPCIMLDCLWYEENTRIRRWYKRLMKKVADRSIDLYLVWASREIEAYSEAFQLPREKFRFQPYHTTLDQNRFQVRDEGYLFSGGNFARDYSTLLEAVDDLPVEVKVASTRRENFAGLRIPPNVDVRGYNHDAYIDVMAGCRLNVVTLSPGLLHSGGQQTFLNSMFMGKPTIVSDPAGAADYISNGENGLLVEPGDPAALREAIRWVLDNPEKARRMGEKARSTADQLSTENHFKQVISLARSMKAGREAAR